MTTLLALTGALVGPYVLLTLIGSVFPSAADPGESRGDAVLHHDRPGPLRPPGGHGRDAPALGPGPRPDHLRHGRPRDPGGHGDLGPARVAVGRGVPRPHAHRDIPLERIRGHAPCAIRGARHWTCLSAGQGSVPGAHHQLGVRGNGSTALSPGPALPRTEVAAGLTFPIPFAGSPRGGERRRGYQALVVVRHPGVIVNHAPYGSRVQNAASAA